jgi:hypothetical protein
VLLACSDGDSIENRRGLSTVDCLDFLLDLGTRDARVCGYYLGYDWTMILWDMSIDDRDAVYRLFRPELRALSSGHFARVKYEGYELHFLAGAMWIRDKRGRKVTVWDLGKYYQGPFISALKAWKIRPDVQGEIEEMKKRRALFTWKEIKRIRQYCMNECEALAELALANEHAHEAADLKPRGWFGPGSTASVLLNRHRINERRGVTPPVMQKPIACAFFGGRAEISRSGHVPGPITGLDISSAYPGHAAALPCLEHARWERVTTERQIRARGVAHAIVHGYIRNAPGAWAPLPIRLDKPNIAPGTGKGTIVFPRGGASGWWWREEWLAAREGWGKGIEFDHAYVLRRQCDCKPFDFLRAIFDQRIKVGKDTGAGKILKLGPNSVYGKLAQTIGKAQFASRTWAGMITSGTRAQVLRLMLQHKRLDSILMIATDGLFSTEMIDVDSKVTLGGWERKTYESITIIRPGIYWLGEDKLRARGLGRDNLNEEAKIALLEALERRIDKIRLKPRDFFVGAKVGVLTINRESSELRRSDHYGQWVQKPTNVSLAPAPKRLSDWSTHTLPDVDSAPYGSVQTREQGELFEILELLRDLMHLS